MNALSATRHGIGSIARLDFSLIIAGEAISDAVNINYTRVVPGIGACTVYIATPDRVQGLIPEDTTVYVDVDVYTKGDVALKDAKAVKKWIGLAHDVEKDEFFHLLTQVDIDLLKDS